MRYIAEFQQPATVLVDDAMEEWRSPNTPTVVSGRIRNLSATKDLLVSFYVEPRGDQTTRIPPLHQLEFANRPAGIIRIHSTKGPPEAVFDYLFIASQVDDSSDLTQILSNGFGRLVRLRLQDLTEYIHRVTLRFVGPVTNAITMSRPNGPEVGIVHVTPALASGSAPIIIRCAVSDGTDGYNEGVTIYDVDDYVFNSWGWPTIAVDPKYYPIEGERSTYYSVSPLFSGNETTFDVTVVYYMAPLDKGWPSTWTLPTGVSLI